LPRQNITLADPQDTEKTFDSAVKVAGKIGT